MHNNDGINKEVAYPEFDTFGKAMPAYGVYLRHVRGVRLQNVLMTLLTPDARSPPIFIDAENITPNRPLTADH